MKTWYVVVNNRTMARGIETKIQAEKIAAQYRNFPGAVVKVRAKTEMPVGYTKNPRIVPASRVHVKKSKRKYTQAQTFRRPLNKKMTQKMQYIVQFLNKAGKWEQYVVYSSKNPVIAETLAIREAKQIKRNHPGRTIRVLKM